MITGDDRFQAEAMCWKLSPLDSCCCQVVVRLQSPCADLSEEEEEAPKLGVDLFNCQASAKGRRTYPCTPGTEELQEQRAGWLRPRLENPVHLSLQQPALDETLIASGEHRVAQLMEDITQRMESDLARLLAQQRWMEEVMEKLRRVNQSLGLMLAAVEGARSRLENSLQHLHAILDPAGRSPGAISTCILHGSFFVLLVALLVPTPPRAILLLLFLASSTLSELLGIPALSTLLALAVAGQWLVASARHGAGGSWLVPPREEPRHRLTSTPDREHAMELLQEDLDRMEISCLQEPSCLEQPPATAGDLPGLAGWVSPVPGGWRTKLSSCGVMLEPALGAGKHWEPKHCSPSQSLASNVSLLSPRSPCQGLTKAGQRCRKKAIPGQDFCHVHTTGRASCSGLTMDLAPRA
ncbi:protein brambleberry-like isoform X2 [Gymnogyps californianus]|uniref:protein brambleberry-like isoform X2 n=1 Tax=Gymnogyps californianus TaxID=33616 RepID=UPI0021C678AC|nr:protein brambleberry-like isoform X2 [Gymnogyps californianus]